MVWLHCCIALWRSATGISRADKVHSTHLLRAMQTSSFANSPYGIICFFIQTMSTSTRLSLVSSGTSTVTGTLSVVTLNACSLLANSSSPIGQNKTTTWGCSPGYVCNPTLPWYCDLWANPPSSSFLCSASECQKAPDYPDIAWPVNQTSYFPPAPGYFNLNPQAFGLNFDIFQEGTITDYVVANGTSSAVTLTTGDWSSQTSLTQFTISGFTSSPQLVTTASAPCYAYCNNCFYQLQRTGKTPVLCEASSVNSIDCYGCRACLSAFQSSVEYLNLQWGQFAAYCDGAAFNVTSSSGSTAGNTGSRSTTKNTVSTSSVSAGAVSGSSTSTRHSGKLSFAYIVYVTL